MYGGWDDDYEAEQYARRAGYGCDEYNGTCCKNCDRARVMRCYNGKLVCEKCGWDQEANTYTDYLRFQ